MNSATEIIGNPFTLLIERAVYLGIGIFFVIAFYKGVQRKKEDND